MALGYVGKISNGLGMLGFRSVVQLSHEFLGMPYIVHARIDRTSIMNGNGTGAVYRIYTYIKAHCE